MQLTNEKKVTLEKEMILENKRLEVIRNLKRLPVNHITEYSNNEIDSILYDMDSELNSLYDMDTKGFGLRLENNIMLYIFRFYPDDYALIDLNGEIIGSTRNNRTNESVALEELYNYCEEEVNNRVYNETMKKFNKILESM